MNLTDLLQDPHIVYVEEGEHWEPVDWSKVPGNQERLSEVYTTLMRDLSLGYCVDDFEDHEKRQMYRIGPNEFLNSVMQKNSLRANSFSGLVSATLAIASVYRGQEHRKISTKVREIYMSVVEQMRYKQMDSGEWNCDYDQMKPMEKLAFVKDLKQQVYGVMKLVAEVNK